jgi:hypothetical protein
MYLEPIFSAQDIQKQLPQEHKAFDTVHKQLRDIMRHTKERPNALQAVSITSETDTCCTACYANPSDTATAPSGLDTVGLSKPHLTNLATLLPCSCQQRGGNN